MILILLILAATPVVLRLFRTGDLHLLVRTAEDFAEMVGWERPFSYYPSDSRPPMQTQTQVQIARGKDGCVKEGSDKQPLGDDLSPFDSASNVGRKSSTLSEDASLEFLPSDEDVALKVMQLLVVQSAEAGVTFSRAVYEFGGLVAGYERVCMAPMLALATLK